jgi:hypothetical protein
VEHRELTSTNTNYQGVLVAASLGFLGIMLAVVILGMSSGK